MQTDVLKRNALSDKTVQQIVPEPNHYSHPQANECRS